jgi:hypothetical protein
MGKFLDHVAAHRLGGCFALTLLGLRREEVGGLRWSDIDLDTGALRIRQARVDVNGRDTIVATKTEGSARDLPLPPHEPAMVKAMRTSHLRERLAVGRPLADDDLLLSSIVELGWYGMLTSTLPDVEEAGPVGTPMGSRPPGRPCGGQPPRLRRAGARGAAVPERSMRSSLIHRQ